MEKVNLIISAIGMTFAGLLTILCFIILAVWAYCDLMESDSIRRMVGGIFIILFFVLIGAVITAASLWLTTDILSLLY